MAPDNRSQDSLDVELRALIETIYKIITQIGKHAGDQTTAALEREISILLTRYTAILRLAPTASTTPIPPDVIEYVQEGRNPDIYTREFVELAMRNNQRLRGKCDAFAAFRDVLAREIAGAVPVLRAQVERVVVHTGGRSGVLDAGERGVVGGQMDVDGLQSAAAALVGVKSEDAGNGTGVAIKVEDG